MAIGLLTLVATIENLAPLEGTAEGKPFVQLDPYVGFDCYAITQVTHAYFIEQIRQTFAEKKSKSKSKNCVFSI